MPEENTLIDALNMAQETIETHRFQIMILSNEKIDLKMEIFALKQLLDKHKIKYTL